MVTTLTTDELKTELSKLNPNVRAELATFLANSLEDGPPIVADPAWEAELDRRIDDMRSGRVRPIPADEMIADIRKKYS